MKFTPENIIENIDKIGPWSAYGLAEEALRHYFPEEFTDDKEWSAERNVELADKLGCQYWTDVIIKFQTEVGYNAPDGFCAGAVNEH